MKFERNFNKRSAPLVPVQQPNVAHSRGSALGIIVTVVPSVDVEDHMEIGALRIHMTPEDALSFALQLVEAARDRLKNGGALTDAS